MLEMNTADLESILRISPSEGTGPTASLTFTSTTSNNTLDSKGVIEFR